MFRVRIVTADHYISSPVPGFDVTFSDFRGTAVKHVPVIRIFGTTPDGIKTCVHVHGVFPYICIPYDGSEPHSRLSYQLAASLDKAINIASGYSTSNTHHVYKIVLVSGIPFYGYHRKKHQFLKIYFYKPSVVKQAANLLQNGAVLNKIFQPHEAHVPFLLQFFIDFNLYGMSFIELHHVRFRKTNHPDALTRISADLMLPDSVQAMSLSQLEIDVSACDIFNRPSSQGKSQISNPGLSAIWEDEKRRRATIEGSPLSIPSLHSQRPDIQKSSSEVFQLARLNEILENPPSQPVDESSLSGEHAGRNVSYAIEEPPNSTALDASFVSLHVVEPDNQSHRRPSTDAYSDDTIVDEDVALMNLSASQRLSQSLDKSLVLDHEDLELLDALETLADSRPAVVDADSILGSQNNRKKVSPVAEVPGEDQDSSDGEDEHWRDKTLLPEQDEVLQLLDLSMPDIDMTLISVKSSDLEPKPSTSRDHLEDFHIPQVDGASNLPFKPSNKKTKQVQIPQVDGLNDPPSQTGRRSLGMRRGGPSKTLSNKIPPFADNRYNSQTGELVFLNKHSKAKPVQQGMKTQSWTPNGVKMLYPQSLPSFSSASISTFSTSAKTTEPSEIDGNLLYLVSDQIDCPAIPDSIPLNQTEMAALESNVTHDEAIKTPIKVQKNLENPDPAHVFGISEQDYVIQCYPDEMSPQDHKLAKNLLPPVACCSSTVVDCSNDSSEGDFVGVHDCAEAYIDMLAKRDVLRGNPSLYPDSTPEKEESLTEFIASEVLKSNSKTEEMGCSDSMAESNISETSVKPHRRSIRLASRAGSSGENIQQSDKALPEDLCDFANFSPCSCSEISDLIGMSNTVFLDLLSSVSSNTEASCSDSEMSRLSGALQNGQMDVILQSGADDKQVSNPVTARREELMLEVQKSKGDCQGTCSQARRRSQIQINPTVDDPVTDELLHRGQKPKAGPPRLRSGKNMELAKKIFLTPVGRKGSIQTTVNPSKSRKEIKEERREYRRCKLSLTVQKKKNGVLCVKRNKSDEDFKRESKNTDSSPMELPECSVSLIKLTNSYVFDLCKENNVRVPVDLCKDNNVRVPEAFLPREIKGKLPSDTQLWNPRLGSSRKDDLKSEILRSGKKRNFHERSLTKYESSSMEPFDKRNASAKINEGKVQPSQEPLKSEVSANVKRSKSSSYVSKKKVSELIEASTQMEGKSLSKESSRRVPKKETVIEHVESSECSQEDEGKEQSKLFPKKSTRKSKTVKSNPTTPQSKQDIQGPSRKNSAVQIHGVKQNLNSVKCSNQGSHKSTMPNSKCETFKLQPMRRNSRAKSASNKVEQSEQPLSHKSDLSLPAISNASGESSLGTSVALVKKGQSVKEDSLKTPPMLPFSGKSQTMNPGQLPTFLKAFKIPKNPASSNQGCNAPDSHSSLKENRVAFSGTEAVKSSCRISGSSLLACPSGSKISTTTAHTSPSLSLQEVHNQNRTLATCIMSEEKTTLFNNKGTENKTTRISPSTHHFAPEDLETSTKDSYDAGKTTVNLGISLETSDIHLSLSESDTEEKSLAKCPSKPRLNTNKLIPCVDGASTEHSSESSSESQNHDQAYLKRKNVTGETDVQGTWKLCRAGEDGSSTESMRAQSPFAEQSNYPKSVAHWFAQPYNPWSMWSPNSSPKAHHHSHVFSPPRPLSPGNPCNANYSGNEAGPSNAAEIFSENDNAQDSIFGMFHGTFSSDDEGTDSEVKSSSTLRTIPLSASPSSFMKTLASKLISSKTFAGAKTEDFSVSKSESLDSVSSVNQNEGESLEPRLSQCKVTYLRESKSLNQSSDFQCGQFGDDVAVRRLSEDIFLKDSSMNQLPEVTDDKSSETILSGLTTASMSDLKCSNGSSDIQCGQLVNDNVSEKRVTHTSEYDRLSTFLKPFQKPPSRQEVLDSLGECQIPQVVNLEPFFGNFADVKGKIEVGGNLLGLTSSSFIHLEEFSSKIVGVKGLREQQKGVFEHVWGLSQVIEDINQLLVNHVNEREVLIAPVSKPPRVHQVNLWSKARHILNLRKKTDLNDCNPQDEEAVMINKSQDVHFQSDVSEDTLYNTPTHVSVHRNNVMQASTPESDLINSETSKIPSPLFTPILQAKTVMDLKLRKKSQSASRKYLRKLSPCPRSLPPVSEEDESNIGVGILDVENVANSADTAERHENSSLRRLLLDSQFCREAASPLVRHDSDASACEIKGVKVSPGFKMALENLQSAKTLKEFQYITILTVEIHISTCGAMKPDPERDPVKAIFFSVVNDVPHDSEIPSDVTGILAVCDGKSALPPLNRCAIQGSVKYLSDEKELLKELIHLVRHWDPDIFAGFEIEMLSWGYLLQRACVLGVNLTQELSRVPNLKDPKHDDELEDINGISGLKITGRIVLDVWRLFRSEAALQSYTFESLMYHILHQRVSHYSFENLSRWWEHPSNLHRWKTVQYYQLRVTGIARLLDQLDIIGRTSELARLFGIQFFEVLSRGSQFRVESMMLRLAKPLNYIPVSPSVQQRAHMRAPECIPLIMEPESRYYKDPIIVLDFQSLYPSMIIAHNYCFSTCLGRMEHLGKSSHFEFGCTELQVSNNNLHQLKDNINVSPCGVAFVTKSVRQGVLPRMLEEILAARLAVKQSMKHFKNDHTLQRVLHARQLGLKLIANVTYGYTSANFSGRMPCIEVGDSVVSKGRETLERAISLVHSNKDWQARVVYGDTDSLFVLVPGRSRKEAFRIGAEIAQMVTQDNPSPVKLKLEKVYQPSILQTKKRYVGFMYENPEQEHPVYEAKGIETVRRDGCPAVAKMLEKSLRLLFENGDVSAVKKYVCRQFSKLIAGQAHIQDLIFAREYRGKENYRPGACVPALELTKRWLRHDRRSEPRIGERVPYVVVNGPPGSALIHLVRHPSELLTDASLRYNAVYYITRAIIPPLARCFSLLGADVSSWYAELPRKSQLLLPTTGQLGSKKTISQYFVTMECACCGELTHGGVCVKCQSNPQLLVTTLSHKLNNLEHSFLSIKKICHSCLGHSQPIDCLSLDCPITYRRHQAALRNEQSSFISQLLSDYGCP